MQTVSTAFKNAETGNTAVLSYGVLISWLKTINSSYNFFTINTSVIGGADIIPGAGSTPTFLDRYQYSDYSDYIDSWSVTRNLGQFPYGAFTADASIVLDNTTLLFMPTFDATIGAYILPDRPVKLSVGYSGELITIFTGYSSLPVNSLSDRSTTLRCYDGMEYLNNYVSATTPVQAGVYFDQILATLLQEAGFSPSQYVIEQSLQKPIGYLAPFGQTIGAIIQAGCEAEQGIAFFDENGVFHFWNRQHLVNNTTPLWTFSYGGTGSANTSSLIDFDFMQTPVINDVIIQAQPRVVQAKQNIWQLASPTLVPAPTSTQVVTNLIVNPSFETDTANWNGNGGTLTQVTSDSAPTANGTSCAQLVSSGITQYLSQAVSPITSGQNYIAGCMVKASAGTVINIKVVQGANTYGTASITATGAWQQLNSTSFAPAANSACTIEIYPSAAATIKVDAVMMVQNSTLPTYFDGNSTQTTQYYYAWTGTANESQSTQTLVGYVQISADFQDAFGALPVTSIDAPVYFATATSSNYSTNGNNDGSGAALNSNIVFISGVLSGSNYLMTFVNTGSMPVYIYTLSLFGTPAKVNLVINQEYSNPTSIAKYGKNPANNGQPLIIQNDMIQDNDTAHSNAYQLVTDYATPNQRIQVDIFDVPQIQIGDCIAITIDDTASTNNYTVIANTLNFTASELISQTIIAEIKVLVKYFQINVSTIGGTDQIAP